MVELLSTIALTTVASPSLFITGPYTITIANNGGYLIFGSILVSVHHVDSVFYLSSTRYDMYYVL